MAYTPTSGEHFSELKETGVDANATSTTASLHVEDNKKVAFHVVAATGTHATHIITLQCSLDNSNWFDTASTITGLGVVNNVDIITHFVRLKVTTNEGGASTVDIIIQGK